MPAGHTTNDVAAFLVAPTAKRLEGPGSTAVAVRILVLAVRANVSIRGNVRYLKFSIKTFFKIRF